jgi:hypothetical protein
VNRSKHFTNGCECFIPYIYVIDVKPVMHYGEERECANGMLHNWCAFAYTLL